MASLSKDGNKGWRIRFRTPDGKSRTIRTGKCAKKNAETTRNMIEQLIEGKRLGTTISPQAIEWLCKIDDQLHKRLAKIGLVEPRAEGRSISLADWCAKYISQRKKEVAKDTVRKLENARDWLCGYFGENEPISAITPGRAADWRVSLLNKKLSEATVRGHIRYAKLIFNAATEREIITKNPFAKLKSASIASDRDRYVTTEEAERIVEACPDWKWRLFFGLMRYAGMRAPSETHHLKWDAIDWQRRRMSVYAVKTKQTRIVPIDPRLMPLLEEGFQKARTGQKRVLTMSRNNLRRNFHVILQRASIAPWEDCFQTLRRSCETEWAMHFPQYAVSQWIGHSMQVSERFYLQVPDDLFDAVSQPNRNLATYEHKTKPENSEISRKSLDKVHTVFGHKSGHTTAGNSLKCDASKKSVSMESLRQETNKPARYNHLQHNAGYFEMKLLGLEPRTHGLKVRCSTD